MGIKFSEFIIYFRLMTGQMKLKKNFRKNLNLGHYVLFLQVKLSKLYFLAIFDEIILILIVISTIKCVSNFGKGFKEMVLKQSKQDEHKNSVGGLKAQLVTTDL
jgi:hypothetical protein